jgi:hypothetical protein
MIKDVITYKTAMNEKKREIIEDTISSIRKFRFCGPSDDPDEQTAVTSGFRHLTIQLQRLAGPLLSSEPAARLASIQVEIDNLYSAYDASSELDALLPDIEEALEAEKNGLPVLFGMLPIAQSRIEELRALSDPRFDFSKLIRFCEEININFRAGCFLATAMLTRAILDHVPPIFGAKSFAEIANNYAGGSKSFKASMQHLETGARNIADGHLHLHIRKRETLPEAQQVDFRSSLDALLAEIVRITQ